MIRPVIDCKEQTTPGIPGRPSGVGSEEAKRLAIDEAFEYRGDVTLTLDDGESVTGYVFNRDPKAEPAYLELFPNGDALARRIDYAHIAAIDFTGTDTASGKSWEAWLAKVARAKADGTIAELYPESNDD